MNTLGELTLLVLVMERCENRRAIFKITYDSVFTAFTQNY